MKLGIDFDGLDPSDVGRRLDLRPPYIVRVLLVKVDKSQLGASFSTV